MGQKFFIQPGEILRNDVWEHQKPTPKLNFFRRAIGFYSILRVASLCRNASLDSSRHTVEKVLNLGKRDGCSFLSAILLSCFKVLGDLFSTRRLMMLRRFSVTDSDRHLLQASQALMECCQQDNATHVQTFFRAWQSFCSSFNTGLASSKMNFRRCHEYLK